MGIATASMFGCNSAQGDLTILVLETETSTQMGMEPHILISAPMRLTVVGLRLRISGATKLPPDRMVLVFAGRALNKDKAFVPRDAFELPEMADEDTNLCRPRICLEVLPPPPEEESNESSVSSIEEEEEEAVVEVVQEAKTQKRHRQSHKQREFFHLDKELEAIECSRFHGVLLKAGLDIEGAFAEVTLDQLHGPGLWLPLSAARLVVEAGKGVGKRAQERTDKHSKSKNEVERALVEKKEIKTLTLAGMGTGEEGAEEGAGALRQFTTKRDLKRAWTKGEDAKKKMETQQKWALEHPKAAYKDHAPLLLQKIEEIRRRCAKESAEAEADFDEITTILWRYKHGEHLTLRSMSAQFSPPDKEKEKQKQREKEKKEKEREKGSRGRSKMDALKNSSSVGDKLALHADPQNQLAQPGARSSSRGQLALSGVATEGAGGANTQSLFADPEVDYHVALAASKVVCCGKHYAQILKNRELFIAGRRLMRASQLQVLIDRLPSSRLGYVTSSTLEAIAAHHLRSYHGIPKRSEDHSLVITCVHKCVLSLEEQRATVLWVRRREVAYENLLSVVPVRWYSPAKFVRHFVDLLEELDRERLVSA